MATKPPVWADKGYVAPNARAAFKRTGASLAVSWRQSAQAAGKLDAIDEKINRSDRYGQGPKVRATPSASSNASSVM